MHQDKDAECGVGEPTGSRLGRDEPIAPVRPIAHSILEPVFAAPRRAIKKQDLELARMVARLNDEQAGPVTVNDIALLSGSDSWRLWEKRRESRRNPAGSAEQGNG